jgi:hypothetical protein
MSADYQDTKQPPISKKKEKDTRRNIILIP